MVTDSEGEVVSRALFSPYGELRNRSTYPTDLGFTAQRQEGFGLMDYGARLYDPQLGRFISPDTVIPDPANPQDFNRYSYVRNNPLKYRDSNGHCIDGVSTIACIAIGLTLVGVLLEANASNPLPPGEAPSAEQGLIGLMFMTGGAGFATYAEYIAAGATAACADGDCTNEARTSVEAVQRTTNQLTQYASQADDTMLNPNSLGVKGSTQPEIFRGTVDSMVKQLKDNPAKFWKDTVSMDGPIEIWEINGERFVYNGNHRFQAAIEAGVEIPSNAIKIVEKASSQIPTFHLEDMTWLDGTP